MPKQVIVSYVPVLHAGYKKLFDAYPEAEIYVFGPEIIKQFDQLRKELRQLRPDEVVEALRGWGRTAHVLGEGNLAELVKTAQKTGLEVIIPDEDVSRELAEKTFEITQAKITVNSIFLRWDRRKMEAQKDPLSPDRVVSKDKLDTEIMNTVASTAAHSTNIWRRVSAALVKDGAVIMESSNRHQPLPHSSWTDGDPRNNSHRGMSIEVSTDMHAEAWLIAQSAKQGIALKGISIYVTTFPCPVCAKLIANAGIAKCYYAVGYSMLDGEEVLRANGVELTQVEGVNLDTSSTDTWEPYPEKPKK